MKVANIRINKQITAPQVRLIDEDGEFEGVFTAYEALLKAQARGLDLVEVSPNAEPPVCKITEFGKFKYEIQKKDSDGKKKTKETKEIRFTVNIGEHDYRTKLNKISDFVTDGHNVKIAVKLKGRDRAHSERIRIFFNKIIEDLKETCMVMGGKVNVQDNSGDFVLTKKK